METTSVRRWRPTKRRVAIVLGIAALAIAVVTISQWRGDASIPTGVAHVDDARRASQVSTTLVLVPLRFVEAHHVGGCARPGDTVTTYVFEPTLPFFGDLRSYAIAEFPPISCTLDCMGTIAGATRAEYEAAMAVGGASSPCG